MGGLNKLLCILAVASCFVAFGNAAISCGSVSSKLAPCITYLTQGGGAAPPATCCSGVKQLNGMAQTTPDRQQACRCLLSAAKSISGLKTNLAAGLPGACNVNIPYPISLSTNCNSIK